MKVTNVKLFRSQKPGMNKAFGHVEFEGSLCVNISILESSKGTFVSWPGYKKADGQWQNNIYFKDEATRNQVNGTVMTQYEQLTGGSQVQSQPTQQQQQTQQTPPRVTQPNPGVPF